ncbi:MAG: hypothetical protein ABRQ38_16710 [Candidatus Eremiobacterota bacterium]
MIGSIGYGMQGQSSGVREKMHQFMQSLSPEERQAFRQSQQGGMQGMNGMQPPPPPPQGMQGMNGMQPPPPPAMQGMNSIGGNNLTSEVRQKFEQFEQTLNPQEKQELHMVMQTKRQQMSGFNGMSMM